VPCRPTQDAHGLRRLPPEEPQAESATAQSAVASAAAGRTAVALCL
jgi:hypothetical protein